MTADTANLKEGTLGSAIAELTPLFLNLASARLGSTRVTRTVLHQQARVSATPLRSPAIVTFGSLRVQLFLLSIDHRSCGCGLVNQ